MDDFWNLWPRVILGREGDEAENNGGDDGENSDDDDDADDEDNQNNSDKPTGRTDEDWENLQKALNAERRANKAKDRELRKVQNQKAAKDQEENDTLEEAKQREAAANTKAEKLAAGILKRDIDSKIREIARDMKFIDVEDAVNLVDRTQISADQDTEDPTDIDIDEDTVKAVVKALAVKKPHFLNRGTTDGEPTGSAHGGSRRRNKQTDEEALREHYPSL